MAISFNEIPINLRVPGTFVEISNELAKGAGVQDYKALLIGGKLSGGTATADTPVQVNSLSEAITLFGNKSELAFMVDIFLQNTTFIDLYCLPVADGTTAADGTLTVTGPSTSAGVIYLYIAGRRVLTNVAVGDTATEIAAAIVAAITASTYMLPVTAAVDGTDDTQVNFTATFKGENGNDIDLRTNLNAGENLPAGVTATIVAMASGAGNSDITTALGNLGDIQFNIVGSAFSDTSNLTALETLLDSRWDALVALEGESFITKQDTLTNLKSFGEARNSAFSSLPGVTNFVSMPVEVTTAIAAQVAFAAQNDPARPFQTLELTGIVGNDPTDGFDFSDRNSLLGSGISTLLVTSDRKVFIERLITTYNADNLGNPDDSYYKVNTILTLSYIRYRLRNRIASRYPRFKLAADGTRFGAGQAVVTPSIIRDEVIALFLELETQGIVEDITELKKTIVAEIDVNNSDRVNVLVSPNLINQFRISASKVNFLQ